MEGAMKISWPLLVGVLLACILILGAGFGLATLRQRSQPAPIEIIPPPATATIPPTPSPEPTSTTGPLRVYVSGAVANPAVYELPPGSIIDDAVRAAGGFATGADPVAINLAAPLADGMQVYVPLLGEVAATPPPVSQPPAPAATEEVRMGGVTIGGLININTATQTDLEMLPGIGPAMAANVIAHREANGPFATIESILDVPGIGEGRFEAIRDLITVGP
jgi:competence protein ComEA